MQAKVFLGNDNPAAFVETGRNMTAMPFKCDRNKASEIHKNGKEESPVGETSKATIRDGLLNFVGQSSLVGQGGKNIINKDIISLAKAQPLLAKISPGKFRALHSQQGVTPDGSA